ncbi:pyruvate kinase alpha/beta domain-containing protein [Streptomyces sp. COG19]|uniref:pyruvate kinase alpha/beta domain-containing protein n=1 Tax=Streptomyces sp. COG19 TaxID=2838870 RepID=UPI002036FAB2
MGDFLGAKVPRRVHPERRHGEAPFPLPLTHPAPRLHTPDEATRAQLNLTWGVETFLGPKVDSTDAMVAQVDEELLRIGRCAKGDIVVITAGSPPGVAGSTNLVRVHHIGEDDSPK